MQLPKFCMALILLSLAACDDDAPPRLAELAGNARPALSLMIPRPQQGESYKILFFGNSITHHAPGKAVGWYGDWGMAASSAEADYVHQLINRFEIYGAEVVYKIARATTWESRHLTYDKEILSEFREFDADIIIVRLGENVSDVGAELGDNLREVIEYLDGDQESIIIVTDTFISSPPINAIVEAAASDAGHTFCRISDLNDDIANTAAGQFENRAVSMHPSDKGMYEIADRIYWCLGEHFGP